MTQQETAPATRAGEENTRLTYLAFDLETVPDDLALADGPPEFAARKNLRDPEKIKEDVERKKAEWENNRIKEFSTDYRRARIVAAGVVGVLSGERIEKVWVATTEDEEKALLEEMWKLLGQAIQERAQLVTFNGLDFDVNLLYWRSMKLRVRAPITKSRLSRRYVLDPHFDVRAVLGDFRNYRNGKLADYCDWLEIESPKEEMDGSEVWPAFCEGRWDDLAIYVLADARAVALIFERVAPYYA